MMSLMALVCFANYLLRASLGACAVVMAAELKWDISAKASLLSAFFWGYFSFNIFGAALTARFGGRVALGLAAASWSACYIAVPFAAESGFRSLWACLLVFGVSQAPLLAASSHVIAVSSAPSERGRVIAVRGVALRVGQALSTLLTPMLCKTVGWRFIFHTFGLISAFAALLWTSLAVVEPHADYESSDSEVPTCEREVKGSADTGNCCAGVQSIVPLQELRHLGVWALMLCHCSVNAASYTLMSWGPTYFAEVLKVPLESVGPALTLPVVTIAIGGYGSGLFMDRLFRRGTSLLSIRKHVIVSLLVLASLLLAPLGYVRSAGLACLILGLVFGALGAVDTGMMANYVDVAPHSTATVVGFGNALATLPGALGPGLIAALLDATHSWSSVFALIGLFMLAAACFFQVHGVAEDVCRKQRQMS